MSDQLTNYVSQPRLLLGVEAAAEQLSISRTSMFAYIKAGAIASVKVGQRRLVPADALADFVRRLLDDQNTATASSWQEGA